MSGECEAEFYERGDSFRRIVMDPLQSLIQAIIVIVILFALALLMRRRGVLAEEHSQILARVVTDLFLPAIVFVTLAGRQIHLSQL